jgi:hypothetical protein
MERAVLAESLSALNGIELEGFSRLYFGAETCERKIPTAGEAREAISFCKKNSLGFSLMTPFVTDAGIGRIRAILPLLSGEDEIIANDFGVLAEAGEGNAAIVAGRLLNRQARDPRIASLGGLPAETREHLSLSQASSPAFREFLLSLGVKRVGLDNLLQGIGTSLIGTGMSASLYWPIAFVSATRMCLLAGCGKFSLEKKVGITACGRECKKFSFRLGNRAFPRPLLLSGNALFFENNVLPGENELASRGIDRIVTNRLQAQQGNSLR